MPRIMGLNLLGVLLGSVAFYMVGFVWYGFLFADFWMAAEGYTEADFEGQSSVWMLGGLLITVLQVIGLGLVLKWRGVSDLIGSVTTAFALWFFFALPFVHYAYLYGPDHNAGLLMVDASHLLAGWVAAAIALSFFD